MKKGDIASIRVDGCYHLARIDFVTERSAHIEFLTKVPVIEGHRKKRRAFYLSRFRPHGVAGVDWTVEVAGVRSRGRR